MAVARIWGRSRAEKIHAKLLNRDLSGIDGLGNVVCMSTNCHRAWENGHFALYPREARQNLKGQWEMELVFFWMKKVHSSMEQEMGLKFIDSAARQVQDLLSPHSALQAVNLPNNSPIISCDIITITADTCEELPDYDIVMLQWDVLRMASLCGGAEPEEEDHSDHEENEAVAAMGEDEHVYAEADVDTIIDGIRAATV